MAVNKILTSLHGRKLGLTSSGGLAIVPTTSNVVNRLVEQSSDGVVADLGITKLRMGVETATSSAATLSNSGLSVISSDVINGSVLTLSAPSSGVMKQIYSLSTASSITFNTTAATIFFGASVDSSALVFDNLGGTKGTAVHFVGISATRWAYFGRNATV
jgi:hypothetical protein